MTHPTQSSRAERLAEIAERARSLWALPKWDVDWLLSELEAADSENAALIRDIESYVSISGEQTGIITRLRSALQEAKLALRPFAGCASEVECFVDARAKDGGSTIMSMNKLRLADFRRAAEVAARLEKL